MRWLLLGGGAVTANLHLPALSVLGWLRDSAVVEPSARNAALLTEAFPGLDVIRSGFEDVLADTKRTSRYDAALIALPNTMHAAAARGALAAGLHVLCEKPLALDSGTCEELDHVAAAVGRKLGVAMVRRYLPSLSALDSALEQDLIGKVLAIELESGGNVAHWPWDTETVLRRDQGGVLVNLGVHFLDYLERIFGALTPLEYRDDAAGGVEVNCELKLRTAAQVPLTLRVSWTHALANRLRVIGERGTLVVDNDVFDRCRWSSTERNAQGELTPKRAFESGDWKPTFESCFVEQYWQFARAVHGDRPVAVSGADAARILRIIEWAYQHRGPTALGYIAPAAVERPTLDVAPAVVTGGTGFVGGAVVERLSELGFSDIVVPVRNFRTGANLARFPAVMRRTDLLDAASVREAVKGVRYVFHLAYGAGGGADSARLTIEGSRNVVRASIEAGAEAVVVFSTCTVYGQPVGDVTESSPHQPALGEYGRSKSEMERACLELAATQSSTRVVIIQPGTVYGPRGATFTELPCRLASTGGFCWIDGGSGNVNYVYVDNLVDAALMAARSGTSGSRFIVVDGVTTWREFLEPVVAPWASGIPNYSREALVALHTRGRRASARDVLRAAVSSPALMQAVSEHGALGPLKSWFTRTFPGTHRDLQRMRPPAEMIVSAKPEGALPPVWLADLFGPNTTRYVSEHARATLGWQPVVSLDEGQRRSVAWLRYAGCHPSPESGAIQ